MTKESSQNHCVHVFGATESPRDADLVAAEPPEIGIPDSRAPRTHPYKYINANLGMAGVAQTRVPALPYPPFSLAFGGPILSPWGPWIAP